jgi:hypothetical protein
VLLLALFTPACCYGIPPTSWFIQMMLRCSFMASMRSEKVDLYVFYVEANTVIQTRITILLSGTFIGSRSERGVAVLTAFLNHLLLSYL